MRIRLEGMRKTHSIESGKKNSDLDRSLAWLASVFLSLGILYHERTHNQGYLPFTSL